MSFIEFSSITIKRFNTFAGEQSQHLWLTAEYPGLVFVKGRNDYEPELGSNGAGKSSLFEALCWCLYGQTTDGMKTGDVTPWEGDTPEVLVVVRKGSKAKAHHILRQGTKVFINNDPTDQTGVDNFLGISLEVFKHTVLFGQGQGLFFDLSPREKMDVLVTALQLDRWDERAEAASAEAKALVEKQRCIQTEIAASEAVVRDAERDLKIADEKAGEWKAGQETSKSDLKARAVDIENRLNALYDNHDAADLAADRAGTEIKALQRNLDKLVDEAAEARSLHDQAAALLRAAVGTVERLSKDQCPTCGQSLKGKDITARVKHLNAEIKRGVPKVLVDTKQAADDAVTKARNLLGNLLEEERAARTTLDLSGPEIARLKAQLAEVNDQRSNKKEEANPYLEQARALRKKIRNLDEDLNKLDKKAADLEPIITRTAYWAKGFKQVRLHQMQEMLEELELVTNALLPESGLHGWEVRYAIEKETKKGTVVSGLTTTVLSPRNKKPVKWEFWSGGEAHRLRLVGALALSEVLLNHAGVATNLEVLDEPTRDLSVEGVHDLCEFLAHRAKSLDKDIFLTGHNVIESAHFSNTVVVVKDRNAVSRILK